MGSFQADQPYERSVHANVVEGKYIGDPGASFTVVSDVYGQIECVGTAIEDFAESMGERMLTIFGIAYPEYARFFAQYADYKAYYPNA